MKNFAILILATFLFGSCCNCKRTGKSSDNNTTQRSVEKGLKDQEIFDQIKTIINGNDNGVTCTIKNSSIIAIRVGHCTSYQIKNKSVVGEDILVGIKTPGGGGSACIPTDMKDKNPYPIKYKEKENLGDIFERFEYQTKYDSFKLNSVDFCDNIKTSDGNNHPFSFVYFEK